jgi:hypothetical protein
MIISYGISHEQIKPDFPSCFDFPPQVTFTITLSHNGVTHQADSQPTINIFLEDSISKYIILTTS